MGEVQGKQPVNPEMVTLARESRGYTQSELASLISVRQSSISKLESGIIQGSDELLESIASSLKYRIGFFHRRDKVSGVPTSELFHRKRRKVPAKLITKTYAKVNILRMNIALLLRSIEIEKINEFSVMDVDEFHGSPEMIAKALRANWNLPPGPVTNLVEVVENAGGIVLMCNLESDAIDGFSQWIPGLPPFFYLNRNAPGDRLRLTLAHEVGHVIMHQIAHPDMETEAFQFASEFLMPESEIRPYLDNVSIAQLASLKPFWRVSMQALLYRADTIGTISYNQKRYLWSQISGFRKKEPPELDIHQEQPTLLPLIMDFHRYELGYSLNDFEELLGISGDDIRDEYFDEPRLRIVS